MKQYTKEIAEALAKRLGEVKISATSEENGTFEVIATSEDIDRHGETIRIDGWDIENYLKNPIILFGHSYDELEDVVGRATDIRFDGTKMIIKGIFASAEANPKAQQLRKLYDEGIIKTVSVGFIPLERDQYNASVITKAELLELSFVPVPANPEALDIMKRCGVDPETFTDKNEDKDITTTLLRIVETLGLLSGEVAVIKKFLVDGKTYSDAEKEQKENLQTAARAINEVLRNFKEKRA
jgi:HK97 family phage prohead protease